MCTVKATPSTADPAKVDSAIIYSKKSGAAGTVLDCAIYNPPLIVMMAHNFDAGTFSGQDSPYPSHIPSADTLASSSGASASVAFSRAESVESQSSQSDLRATAAEFVPKTASAAAGATADKNEVVSKPAINPTADLLGDKKFELDMYGIPWFYYMYQVQFAFDQGFQYGRAKSPRKTRNRKQNASAPADGQPQQNQKRSTDMPPPASTVPLAEQRAQQQRAQQQLASSVASPDDASSTADRPFSPFQAQKDAIARQASGLRETINTSTPYAPSPPNVDLNTNRNVPSYTAPHNMYSQPFTQPHSQPNYYTNSIPHRPNNYNNPTSRRNYNRTDNGLYTQATRNMVGVPMHSTVPFPSPVPPQGRPMPAVVNPRSRASIPEYRNVVGSEACGVVETVMAAERVGGEACNVCEPDHPLDG